MPVSLPKPLMLTVAFIQGICFFLLYQAIDLNRWPSTDPVWLFPCLALVIAVPTFFLLLIDEKNLHKALFCLMPFAVAIAFVSFYAGLQLTPQEFVRNNLLVPLFVLTIGIAAFKALMYAQAYSSTDKAADGINYSSLFQNSWRNFLVLGLSLLFTLLFYGVLLLWGLLFDIINIDFFLRLFREAWFILPVGSVAFAFAIITFRSLSKVIDSISALLKALIKFLLPLLSGIALVFLLALIFQGFAPLWETNLGSGLVLWLQALILFSVNAVYQGDAQERPYPLMIHRLIYLSVGILPIYSLIALYGLFSRIGQYGLTVQRCWAVFVALMLFCFAIGYLWGIIKKRDNWLEALAWVNVRMGVLIMAMMVLINSPVANFQLLSTQNQLGRLAAGILTPNSIDLNYFKYNLGRQGYLAMEYLKQEYGPDNPALVSRIDALNSNQFPFPLPPEPLTLTDIQSSLTVWPEGRVVPDEILLGILSRSNSFVPPFQTVGTNGAIQVGAYNGAIGPGGQFARPVGTSFGFSNLNLNDRFYAVFVEMNSSTALANNSTEEVIIIRESIEGLRYYSLWFLEGTEWGYTPINAINSGSNDDIADILARGQIDVLATRWNDVQIGDLRLNAPEQPDQLPTFFGPR